MVAGQGLSALSSSILILAVYYGAAALIYVGYRLLNRKSTAQGTTDRLLGRIPILGKLRRMLALERFAEVFRIYLLSAFRPSEAISAAADASQSGYLREQSALVSAQLVGGQSLGAQLLANSAFPKDFAAGMSTAEQSGTLEGASAVVEALLCERPRGLRSDGNATSKDYLFGDLHLRHLGNLQWLRKLL